MRGLWRSAVHGGACACFRDNFAAVFVRRAWLASDREAPLFLLRDEQLSTLTCAALARAQRAADSERRNSTGSRRSRATPLSVAGPPRAAEPCAWLGPVARSEGEHDGSSFDVSRRGQAKETCTPSGDARGGADRSTV